MRQTRQAIQNTWAIHMTGISDFVQQSHNFIGAVVKLPQGPRQDGAIVHLGRTPMNG
jgi:hypothetical protein